MELKLQIPLKVRGVILLVCGLLMSTVAFPQLPTATQVAANMKVGINVGNTLEAIGGETAWGNPLINQTFINSVKAAGFNTVRLPIAWDIHATNGTIDAEWIARVKQVVDYCINQNLYVIINIHWDNGWLENNVTTSAQASVNAKQQSYWTQIANYFKAYDQRVLFASANEPNVEDATGMSVLLSYHQTFVDAVRATGGNNSSRTLIIQGPSTDIEKTNQLMNTMPTDQIANRMMVEVHYYTPYQFCLMTEDASWGSMFYYWGNGYHSTIDPTRNATWGEEADLDNYFGMMQTKFVNNGIPVIIGEFGAYKRTGIADQELHNSSVEYFNKYVVQSAISHGMIPYYWDTGGLIDRNTGAIKDQGVLDALMEGAGGNCTPSTITPYVQINGGSWQQTANTTVSAGGSVKFGPQPTSGGSWSWSGPNGFSATTREVTISNIQTNQAGSYEATYTNSSGCQSTQSFNVTVTSSSGGGSGTILREYWTGISGTGISNLTSNSNYPNNPTGSDQLTSLEGPTDWANSYGTRIRGYIHPTTSGSYTFWVAGDDNTDLYLSTNDNPANASRIAYVSGWTSSRQWNKYSTQQSASVNLTAGQKYYVEVLHKEGSGGDNVAVAWQGPGITQQVIGGSYLSPYAPGSGSGTIVVRARGTQGGETIDLRVDDNTIATWTLTTSYANYTASGSGTVTVHFTNDDGGRDVQVDYVTIGGTTYQSENQATNTAVWQNSSCGGSNSEWLNCNGYISYSSAGARLSESQPDDLEEESSFQLYPNPSEGGTFHVSIPSKGGNASIMIFDIQGKLVHKQVVREKEQINASLKSGIYMVRINSGASFYSRKLIVE